MERIGHKYIDAESNRVVDVWFPRSNRAISRNCLAKKYGVLNDAFVTVPIGDLQAPPATVEDVYLRLHLLSECQVKPNEVNLQGLFSLLNNVAWTSAGPVLPERVEALRELIAEEVHTFSVPSIDKFPRMSDYVIPDGVRIADADRVRLGAHVASGTTVMHEGFINFNAGTLGESMVEGRITPGVIVGNHSDVGAGSSIMGTLSGGGKQVNSIGENSLLGANSGIGISLGNDCVVEAGLYVTAGTKVRLPDGEVVAARTLSGQSGLLFRRNSQTGCVEVLPTGGTEWGGLNQDLHNN
ncbi:MAG: tetrahydrodipicolinate succinyltransferase [Pseudomonadales bacterium]|nr:tetrahydrodipicolinate succinyltransferase [Pseudomonadales bacterium]MEC8812259.1 DapH/DapD/GlmU-related protein [Pseudomonadota bacterium]RLT89328.1 MAG: tetrahydrodipicolinate succinyltransferase [Ketobacter sp. GenoA1]RLT95826.1 MAG: tetrahydrodipicolinate succinyltransferase [Ketobacter sp.]TNC86618.1 MAG: tetrahydrodipicolinate succinyltransferase [Alcanivorax sp.]HBO95367.1 tetrahydrodipicolinate succinyltransferase [Gammaproteobacteria bacterium]